MKIQSLVILAFALCLAGCTKYLTQDDPRYSEIVAQANKEADAYFKSHPEYFADKPNLPRPGHIGYVHVLWPKMQEIIREKYGLEWKSPADQHPETNYD